MSDWLGLHGKYIVKRQDGRDEEGEKHVCCDYFVLDLTHDLHVLAAIEAYAKSCALDRPVLASDLLDLIADWKLELADEDPNKQDCE